MIIRNRAAMVALALGAALAPALAVVTASPSPADPAPNSDRTCTSGASASRQDLDNDGFSDIAVGVPDAAVNGKMDAGVVDVHFAVGQQNPPSPQRVSVADFSVDVSAGHVNAFAGDRFGASSAYVDANGDDCLDLAIGLPGAEHGEGAVLLVLGSPSGLSLTGAHYLANPVAAAGGPPDHFGASIAADGADLYIGAPGTKVGSAVGAGAVYHYETANGDATIHGLFNEDSAGIPGVAEPNDHFGAILSANGLHQGATRGSAESGDDYLAVGEPDEDVGSAVNAGKVTVLHYGFAEAFTQNSRGVPDKAESGDHFGAAVTVQARGFAVGVPGENVDGVKNAGMVQLFGQNATRLAWPAETITQRTAGVPGRLGAGADFGASVGEYATGLFGYQHRPLAIAAPGARVGSAAHAGAVVVGDWTDPEFRGRLKFVSSALHQGATGIGGTPETGDRFGTGLSALDSNVGRGGSALVISTPGENVGTATNAGVLQVYDPAQSGTSLHDSAGPTAGEHYGIAAFGNLNNSSRGS